MTSNSNKKLLMAAAPDMLAALRLFIAYNDDESNDVAIMSAYGDAIKAARAGVKKAEGKS